MTKSHISIVHRFCVYLLPEENVLKIKEQKMYKKEIYNCNYAGEHKYVLALFENGVGLAIEKTI
jgi:hypothetical protein